MISVVVFSSAFVQGCYVKGCAMLKDVQGLSNRLPIIDITKDKHFKPVN